MTFKWLHFKSPLWCVESDTCPQRSQEGEPCHSLSQGLLGATAPSSISWDSVQHSNNGNSQHACLQVSPRHPSGYFPTRACLVPCVSHLQEVSMATHKSGISNTWWRLSFGFSKMVAEAGHGLLGNHLLRRHKGKNGNRSDSYLLRSRAQVRIAAALCSE